MGVTTTRTPRGSVLLRANECTNPRLGSTAGWYSTAVGSGTGGTAADAFDGGSGELRKTWSVAPTTADGAGFFWRHWGWTAGQQKTASIDLYPSAFEPKIAVRIYHYSAAGVALGSSLGTPFQTTNNTWARVAMSSTAPAGTAYTDIVVCITPGNYPQANQGIAIRHLLVEPGTTAGTYFDGNTFAGGNGTQFTTWEAGADSSRSLLWDIDPLTSVQPVMVLGYDVSQQSRNIIHRLIDGPVAAALYPASMREGTLRLLFADATAAERARIAHAGGGYWVYADSDQPQEAMTYVVDGKMRKYQDEARHRWVLEIPYTEITP